MTEKTPLVSKYILAGNQANYKRWVANLPPRRKTSFKRGFKPVQLTLFHQRIGRK